MTGALCDVDARPVVKEPHSVNGPVAFALLDQHLTVAFRVGNVVVVVSILIRIFQGVSAGCHSFETPLQMGLLLRSSGERPAGGYEVE